MKTVVILGASQFRRGTSRLFNTEYTGLVGFGDNDPSLYHLDKTEKQERGFPADVPIPSVDQAVRLEPDYVITGVADPARPEQLKSQAVHSGFHGKFVLLRGLYEQFDIRSAALERLARYLHRQKIPGHIAELGVYKEDTAWRLNVLFLDRRLYLFDTFEGFDPRDIEKEETLGCSWIRKGEFSGTSETTILNRLPFPQNAVIRKGYFPGTIQGLEDESYVLVSLDADLYALFLSGSGYFYPRPSPGGMILLRDYNNERFQGTRQAVEDYEKCCHPLIPVPLCDLHGSVMTVRLQAAISSYLTLFVS